MNDNTAFNHFYESSGICTDTRKIEPGCLYICIKGENFDGNKFASKALSLGAKHVIVDNQEFFSDSENMSLVDDSVIYLQQLANFHRKKFSIPIIGITGSNGKTTTKELIHSVLDKKYNVLATIGNLNNHLGVPFTLLRLKDEHDIAIIEMGANKPGDIEELCNIAEPTYGIITNIGKAHLEGFKTFEGVLKTKTELYNSIEQNKGQITVNIDDEVLMNALPKVEFATYGTNNNALIKGELVELSPYVHMKLIGADNPRTLKTQMIGKYNFYNYLAAATFGHTFDVPYKDICEAIEEYTPTNNRSQVKKTAQNTLILDCYNANPTSTQSALESFSMNKASNKLFILGDMRELGTEAEIEHQKIIELAEKYNLTGFVVGEEYSKINSSSILKKFKNSEALVTDLKERPITEKLILLKGSRGIKLEIAESVL